MGIGQDHRENDTHNRPTREAFRSRRKLVAFPIAEGRGTPCSISDRMQISSYPTKSKIKIKSEMETNRNGPYSPLANLAE